MHKTSGSGRTRVPYTTASICHVLSAYRLHSTNNSYGRAWALETILLE